MSIPKTSPINPQLTPSDVDVPVDNERAESRGVPIVEFHGFTPQGEASGKYGRSTIDRAIDVTKYVTHIDFSHSTQDPWEVINLELKIPWRELQRIMPGPVRGVKGGARYRHPSTGFWVVVRHYNADTQYVPEAGNGYPAVAWGWVKRNKGGIKVVSKQTSDGGAPGQVVTKRIQITAVSWIKLLESSRIAITPDERSVITEGFWYTLQAWGAKIDQIIENGLDGTSPGRLFEILWADQETPGLCHILLPNTLASEFGQDSGKQVVDRPRMIKDEIPLIWDRATCAQYAPQRLPQMLWVPGSAFNAFGNTQPRGTLWQWLMQTFAVDPKLVELFPVLSYPSFRASDFGQGFPVEDTPGGVVAAPAQGRPLAGEMTTLGKALGAQPGLMYRLKPFLLAPLNQATGTRVRKQTEALNPALTEDDRQRLYEIQPMAERVAVATAKFTSYGQEPVDPLDLTDSGWYSFDQNEIVEFDFDYDEADRVNAVYVHTPLQPTTQIELYGLLGVPVLSLRDVRKYGLRMYDVEWPFLPSSGDATEDGEQSASLSEQITALIDLFYAILGCEDESYNFGRGMLISKVYKPWLKAGNWITGELPPWDQVEDANGFLRAAGLSEEPLHSGFTAYATDVKHSCDVDANGTVTRSTMVTFERLALFGPELYPFPFPLRAAAVSTKDFILDDGVLVWGDRGTDGVFVPDPGYDPADADIN